MIREINSARMWIVVAVVVVIWLLFVVTWHLIILIMEDEWRNEWIPGWKSGEEENLGPLSTTDN